MRKINHNESFMVCNYWKCGKKEKNAKTNISFEKGKRQSKQSFMPFNVWKKKTNSKTIEWIYCDYFAFETLPQSTNIPRAPNKI